MNLKTFRSGKTSRSRSPSPNKGRSSTSKSLQHNERSNVKGKRPHSIENRSKQRRRDESDVDDEDMETRSAKKKQFTPSVKPNDTSTPRSRRTSARTRLTVKQDQLNKPYSDKIEPTSETETEFKDTPKHLYGKKIFVLLNLLTKCILLYKPHFLIEKFIMAYFFFKGLDSPKQLSSGKDEIIDKSYILCCFLKYLFNFRRRKCQC